MPTSTPSAKTILRIHNEEIAMTTGLSTDLSPNDDGNLNSIVKPTAATTTTTITTTTPTSTPPLHPSYILNDQPPSVGLHPCGEEWVMLNDDTFSLDGTSPCESNHISIDVAETDGKTETEKGSVVVTSVPNELNIMVDSNKEQLTKINNNNNTNTNTNVSSGIVQVPSPKPDVLHVESTLFEGVLGTSTTIFKDGKGNDIKSTTVDKKSRIDKGKQPDGGHEGCHVMCLKDPTTDCPSSKPKNQGAVNLASLQLCATTLQLLSTHQTSLETIRTNASTQTFHRLIPNFQARERVLLNALERNDAEVCEVVKYSVGRSLRTRWGLIGMVVGCQMVLAVVVVGMLLRL